MSKQEKINPINRRQFMEGLPEPYDIPEQILQPYQNESKNLKETTPGVEKEFKRAHEVAIGEGDQIIRITLEDHDISILNYIKNTLKPVVKLNGKMQDVPVIYGSPERWKSIQKDGFYRDKNGKIQSPLIILKRENFTKNRNIGNKLDGNSPKNIQYFKKGWSKRNSYDNFNVLQNQKLSEEYQVTIIPDYLSISYSITIFSDFVEHMNDLIEMFEFASDSYWGDKDKFLFRTYITNYPTPVVVESGNDRLSKSTLELTVHGYIIPKGIYINNVVPIAKSFNVTKVIFDEKVITSSNERDRRSTQYIQVPCETVSEEPFIKFISGINNIIPQSEHNKNPISSIEVYDSNTNHRIHVQIVNNNGLVTISTNVPLDNHKLIIA